MSFQVAAIHPQWRDSVIFETATNTFRRNVNPKRVNEGVYTYYGHKLVLKWNNWGEDTMIKSADGVFRSDNFSMKFGDNERKLVQVHVPVPVKDEVPVPEEVKEEVPVPVPVPQEVPVPVPQEVKEEVPVPVHEEVKEEVSLPMPAFEPMPMELFNSAFQSLDTVDEPLIIPQTTKFNRRKH